VNSNQLVTRIISLAFLAFLGSCTDDKIEELPPGDYADGYFITNEGPFQNGTGTITYVGNDGSVSQEVFRKVNGEDLGNIVNSMYLHQSKAFVVVNNSSRIVVADRNSMQKVAVIEGEGIENPRHFIVSDGLGYVSNWGDPNDATDDFISVIDLDNYAVLKKIAVGEGPERMVANSTGLFVALQGGYGQNNKVVLIDTGLNEVGKVIEVGDVPNSLAADTGGDVWVLCGGVPAWTGNETRASLVRIRANDLSTVAIDFSEGDHPGLLNLDGERIYFNLDGAVYQMSPSSPVLPSNPLDGLDGFYYGMMVKNGELYGTDAADFASEGTVKVFNVNSQTLLGTIQAGIVPGSVVLP
jgi:YVTN family beta-propeller protein